MAEQDFTIVRTPKQITKITGNTFSKSFSPTAGENVAIAYINPATGNDAAVNAKLNEIAALCEGSSGEFQKKIWQPTAQEDCVPRVDIHIVVRDDIPEGL